MTGVWGRHPGSDGVLVVGIVGALRARGAPWELRLDASGTTVRGHQLVPWSDLPEGRVNGLRPRWLFWFSLGYRVVSFVAAPGVHLPALPSTSYRSGVERLASKAVTAHVRQSPCRAAIRHECLSHGHRG